MSVYGIICEFNPFHNGHKRIIDEAKRLGAECVVVAMSGNAVQRGELAALDKYTRAKAAVLCGADLVLELPFPWSSASAESFAECGVEILSHFCDNIIFGSECGDINYLRGAAEASSSESFCLEYNSLLESGEGAAKAYCALLEREGFGDLSSNDLLGVEYIKAASKYPNITLHTVKRKGAEYNDTALGESACPSASAIRAAWGKGEYELQKYIPTEALEVFDEAIKNGEITDEKMLSQALLMHFRLADPEELSRFAQADGGVANRICTIARKVSSFEELFTQLKTKRYTDAKLRRAILFCLTGVEKETLKRSPEYTTLLGASAQGRAVLSAARKDKKITVVTKPADAPTDSEQYKLGRALEAIFTLGLRAPAALEDSYRKNAFIKD